MKILTSAELGREACKIVEKVKRECSDEVGESVRSRSRDLYGYLFKTGILSTISYIYAKGGEDLTKKAFDWLSGDSRIPPSDDREELGYAIYGAAFCVLLKKSGLIEKDVSLLKIVELLTSNSENTLVIEDQALKFAAWLKKFAEALLTKSSR